VTPDSAYSGRAIAFATTHGKEALAREALREILGAIMTAPPGPNTEQAGTFAGDIPRTSVRSWQPAPKPDRG
jgi:hypothetical protein